MKILLEVPAGFLFFCYNFTVLSLTNKISSCYNQSIISIAKGEDYYGKQNYVK